MADLGTVSDDVAARREVADRMAEAARAWLDTLDADQRAIGQGAVPANNVSDNERRRWFYTPTDHGGAWPRSTGSRSGFAKGRGGLPVPVGVPRGPTRRSVG